MNLKGKRVLVTGGAGFIGSHVCERLLEEGADVAVLDDFSTGKRENLDQIKKDIKIIIGNVENRQDVAKAVKGSDIIVHEAFPYGKSGMGLNEHYTETGVLGTFNVLKSAVENGVKKVVFASTVSVYGIPRYVPLDEKHPIEPFLPYGATKYVGELYCSTFAKLYGLDTVSLRYFYVYGPRYAQFDHSAMVNFMHRAVENKPLLIYGDGAQVRDYTYISDAVAGTLLAIKKENTRGEVYNISSGNGIAISDLAKKVVSVSPHKVDVKSAAAGEYRYSDKYTIIPIGLTTKKGDTWIDERNYVGDISKAKRELGYNPSVTFEEGIKKTMAWMAEAKRG
ncbi:MAG: SDR family NAD(P)-dependent oxidoreductase [Dehalococcoidales bacterium]